MGRFLVLSVAFVFFPGIAHAYIGPGMGAGTIAAVLGVVASVFIGLFAVVYYPIKRAIRRKKSAAKDGDGNSDTPETSPDGD